MNPYNCDHTLLALHCFRSRFTEMRGLLLLLLLLLLHLLHPLLLRLLLQPLTDEQKRGLDERSAQIFADLLRQFDYEAKQQEAKVDDEVEVS